MGRQLNAGKQGLTLRGVKGNVASNRPMSSAKQRVQIAIEQLLQLHGADVLAGQAQHFQGAPVGAHQPTIF